MPQTHLIFMSVTLNYLHAKILEAETFTSRLVRNTPKVESLGLHGHLLPHPWHLPCQPLFEALSSSSDSGARGVEVSAVLQDPGHVAQELCQAVVLASVHPGLDD